MITSSSNAKVKQVVQWQNKARERREAGIFLAEGRKLFREAPEDRIREVYLSERLWEPGCLEPDLREKLKRTGYETVSEEVFRKMSDTGTPQGILCVVKGRNIGWSGFWTARRLCLWCWRAFRIRGIWERS